MTEHNTRVDEMLGDKSFHIEFHGYLSNHAKHAVIALNGLGAPAEDIAAYVEEYARTTYGFGLEPPKQSDIQLTEENWRDFLGKHEQFTSLCRFFEERVETLGLEQTLKVYVPELLRGCVGALLHGTIHLGWALDAGHRGMTIEGLAYLAFSYVSCYPERTFSKSKPLTTDSTPLNSMQRIAAEWDRDRQALSSWVDDTLSSPELSVAAGFQPVLEHTGAQLHIARVLAEGHPLIHTTPLWMENAGQEEVWGQLYYAVMLLYLSNPGDFVLLHLVTSLHAVEQIARHLPRDEQSKAIKCYWTAMLGVLFSLKAVPTKASLDDLHARYADSIDAAESASVGREWKSSTERALAEREEHNPKLVYVLRKLWARFGHRSVYRVAAGCFTETPVIAPDPVQSTGN